MKQFHFTVTDVARFLGKSPVTLRGWERQGLVTFPRDSAGDRRFDTNGVRSVARLARSLNRISADRLNLVITATTVLDVVEKENK